MHQTTIAFHIGTHCTDDDQLVRSLLKNVNVLSEQGVAAPAPGRYRTMIRSVLDRLEGGRASQDTQDVLFEHIMDTDDAERLVLSNQYFLSNDPGAFKRGQLYPGAREATTALRNLFPDNRVEFFIAIRNPATFIPALYARLQRGTFSDYIGEFDPSLVVWSDVIRDIREGNPDAPITIWCNEDTPLIWPEVMHEITGIEAQVQFKGGFDILGQIIAKEGMQRLRGYLKTHPPVTEIQRRRILSAFLDKYAIDEEVEEELDLPGWTPEIIEHLTSAYDDDIIEIGRIPGVTVLTA